MNEMQWSRPLRKGRSGQGGYLKLAFEIEEFLLSGRWRMRMNYAAIAAALALDIGFSPRILPVFAASFSRRDAAVFIEASTRPEQATFPLRCSSLIYEGPARRAW